MVEAKIKFKRQAGDLEYKEKAVKAQINDIYQELEQIVQEKQKEIEKNLLKYDQSTQALLQSIPGLGPITAASLISEVTDINKFKEPKHLVAFCGIDPRVHESGESIKGKGYITKRGNKILRTILYNAVSVAVLHSNVFQDFFQKKRSEGKPYRVALIATMRKMVHVIHAVWTNNRPFIDKRNLVNPQLGA